MKLLVETTGDFQLVHSELHEQVRAQGFSVIHSSQWANSRVSIGQLLTKAQLNDEATDAEWLETLQESDYDVELALASFVDRFPADRASATKAEPPPKPQTSEQLKHNAPKPAPAKGGPAKA